MRGLIDHELIEELKLISKYLDCDVDGLTEDEIQSIEQKYKHLKYKYRKLMNYRKHANKPLISFEEYLKGLINNKVATPEERKLIVSQRFFEKYHGDEEFRKQRIAMRVVYQINHKEREREYRRNYVKRKLEKDPDYRKKINRKSYESRKKSYEALSEEEKLAYKERRNERKRMKRSLLSPEEYTKLLEKERAYRVKYYAENPDKLYQWYLNDAIKNKKTPLSKEEYIERLEARRKKHVNLEECDLSFLGEENVFDKNLPKEEINRRRSICARLRTIARKNGESPNIIKEYKKKNGITPKALYSLEDAEFILRDSPLSIKDPERFKKHKRIYEYFRLHAKEAGYEGNLFGTRQYIEYLKVSKEEDVNFTYKQVSFVFVKGSMDKDMKNKKLLTRRLMTYNKLKVMAAKLGYKGTLEGVKKLVLTHIKPSELKKD